MRSVTILSNLFLLKKTMMVHSLSYVHMLDHPWCILDQWSNNHHTVVQYLGRWQILDRLWHFIVFQFYQKNPGYGLFWRDMRIPWMNTFGLEWISSACLNLPRWNGSRCLGGPISIALPYKQFFISRWTSNDGDFRLRDGGFQQCQNDGVSVRMTEGWHVCIPLARFIDPATLLSSPNPP